MISTEDALWEAVGANPADSLPRLVLADCLDEQGEADTAAGLRATADRRPMKCDWQSPRANTNPHWTWLPDTESDAEDEQAAAVGHPLFAALSLGPDRPPDDCYRDYPTARAAIADLVAAWVAVNTTCPECEGRGKTHRPYPGGWDDCSSCHGTGKVAHRQCSETIQT